MEMSIIDGNCRISIKLKEQTREYTVKIKFLEEGNHLPYAEMAFLKALEKELGNIWVQILPCYRKFLSLTFKL